MLRSLQQRPSCEEVLMCALHNLDVPEAYYIDTDFRSVIRTAMQNTLKRLNELGCDYWTIESTSRPLVDGKCRYPLSAETIALFDLRILDDGDPAVKETALCPVSKAEFESIYDGSRLDYPTVWTVSAFDDASVTIWPTPQGFGEKGCIAFDALTWVRRPEWWESWRIDALLDGLAKGLAYNIKKRWWAASPPIEYLKQEAELAYRLMGPIL